MSNLDTFFTQELQLSRVPSESFNPNPKQTGRFIVDTTVVVVVVVVVLNIRTLTEAELPSRASDRAGVSSLNTDELSRFLAVGFGIIAVCPPPPPGQL